MAAPKRLLAMRTFLLLLLGALLVVPTSALAGTEYTSIDLTNGTSYWVFVDTYEHYGRHEERGMLEPNRTMSLRMSHREVKFFTDVYVYVKKGRSSDPKETLCTVRKTFGNTTGRSPLQEHVHYNGTTCSIDPA